MNRLLLALALTLLAAPAAAQPQMVFPYSGVLDLDGAPFTGEVQMRFRLYGADLDPEALPGDACAEPPCIPANLACDGEPSCLWEETHTTVQVFQGRFTVRLGAPAGGAPPSDLGPILRTGPQLYIEIAVRPAPDAGWTFLSGRQQIAPVPQALWSADQESLRVDRLAAGAVDVAGATTTGSLAVAGATTTGTLAVAGAATTRSLDVNGDIFVRGNLDNPSAGARVRVSDAQGLEVTRGSLIVSAGGLTVSNGALSVGGGATVGSNVTVGGGLTLGGDLAAGDLRVVASSGLISDADGPVTIGDSLVVGGPAEFRSDAGATFAGAVQAPYFDGQPRITHHLNYPAAESRRAGVVDANLVRSPTDRGACFLIHSSIAGLDNDAADWGYCSVLNLGAARNHQWIVRAYASPDTDAVSCKAACLTW